MAFETDGHQLVIGSTLINYNYSALQTTVRHKVKLVISKVEVATACRSTNSREACVRSWPCPACPWSH